jgi:hypothetical protein
MLGIITFSWKDYGCPLVHVLPLNLHRVGTAWLGKGLLESHVGMQLVDQSQK